MTKLLLNMVRRMNRFGIFILQVIILSIFACSDNFSDVIKSENLNINNNATIINDLPIVSFAASSSYTSNENETAHAINIILSKSSADIVTVIVADLLTGTATIGTDYTYTDWSSPEVVTFNPGETLKTINITPVQDSIREGASETIFLELSSPINAILGLSSHQVIIYDDDTLPELPNVSFATSWSSTADENTTPHTIDILLSQSSESIVTVIVADLLTGTASAGTDYTYTGWSSPEVITFNPGETLKTVSITPVQDTVIEAGETIDLELSSPANAQIGISFHEITITDDDGWIELDEIAAPPRAGAATAIYGDWIYIYGGETYSGAVLDDFWRYNLSTNEYETLESVGARAYATLVDLNGKLYLFGGKIDVSGTLYNDKVDGIYYYDTSLSTWASFKGSDTTGPFPDARACHVAVPLYNSSGPVERIYLHGGTDTDDILHKIDLTTYTWQTPQYKISFTRSEHSAAYYNGYIYFFGGYDNETYYNDLWRFNITSPNFSPVILTGETIIPERSGISMIEYNGKLYVFGGKNSTTCFDDLWSYSSGSWEKISTAPFKRCFYSAVKYNDSLIIFGGYYLNSSSQKVYSSELWQYNLK